MSLWVYSHIDWESQITGKDSCALWDSIYLLPRNIITGTYVTLFQCDSGAKRGQNSQSWEGIFALLPVASQKVGRLHSDHRIRDEHSAKVLLQCH